MMKRIASIITVAIFVFDLAGCGYTTRSMIDPNLKTIYIQPFSNEIDIFSEESQDTEYRTYFPLLERDITNNVVNRFVFDGNLKVVKKEKADLILKGKLLNYQRDPIGYTETDEDEDEVEEYRISLIVDISLYNTKTEGEMWHETNFVGDTTYYITGALAKSEAAAIKEAINDLAARVVERVVENW